MSRALLMIILLVIGLVVGWVGRSFSIHRKQK
jgi:cell division protein FtsX